MRPLHIFQSILLAGVLGSARVGAQTPANGDAPDDRATEPKGSASGTAASKGTASAGQERAQGADDLESLKAEYLKLRDRLFQSRARAATVASALYSTRVSIRVRYKSSRFYTVTRSTLRLDGANVFDDSSGSAATDNEPRFEGYIAPGRHTLSIRIEATGKDDERFTSVLDNSLVFQAPRGKDVMIEASASDDGSMSFSWEKKQQGSYKLHLDVSIKAVERSDQKSEHIRRSERRAREEKLKRG